MISDTGSPRRFLRVTTLLLAVISAGALAGCAMFRKFDMVEIHQRSAARPQRNPVILIHGALGDDLPGTHVEGAAGVRFYGAILNFLRDAGGYRQGDIGDPQPEDTLFVYDYDWRRDNVESAAGLGRAIQQIKDRRHAPDMRFDLVAHGMGGLVAHYYLGYGTEDVIGRSGASPVTWAGAPNIGRMILIGTPLRGTMSAFRTLNTGFSRLSPAVVFTMDSIYQLLPSDGREHVIDPQGNPVAVDFYDADDWVRNRWSVFKTHDGADRPVVPAGAAGAGAPGGDVVAEPLKRFLQSALDRARSFHDALAAAAVGGSAVPVHLFGSDCVPTLDRAVLKRTPSGSSILFDDEGTSEREDPGLARRMLAPGDGTVTAGSLLASGVADRDAADRGAESSRFASTYFFCEPHGFLPGDHGFLDNLLYALFRSPERPAHVARASGM